MSIKEAQALCMGRVTKKEHTFSLRALPLRSSGRVPRFLEDPTVPFRAAETRPQPAADPLPFDFSLSRFPRDPFFYLLTRTLYKCLVYLPYCSQSKIDTFL